MKRKVIKQGNNTLTITLPRDWTEKFGVKVGDEVDLEERGRQLLLESSKPIALDKIQIDAMDMDEKVLRWVMSAAHKSGYDEIEILHYTPKQIELINEATKDLFLGFSIVDQSSNRCLIKSVSKELDSEFDIILRRSFLVALSMADNTLSLLKKRDYERLTGLIALEHSNNQFSNFCERIINKVGHKDYKKNCFYYVIAWNLEKICDDYKYLCEYFPEKKFKIKNDILDMLEKANHFFRGYYELFYKFDIKDLINLSKKGKELIEEARSMSKSVKNEGDFIVLNTVLQIVLKSIDFSTTCVAIHGLTKD